MLRLMTVLAIGLTLTVTSVHYALNYDTRRLELRVQAQERLTDKLTSEISVLKAERAYLARPERIEPAARALGLEPAKGNQYVKLEAISATQRPALSAGLAAEPRLASALPANR
jgi:cell division protein FtsL